MTKAPKLILLIIVAVASVCFLASKHFYFTQGLSGEVVSIGMLAVQKNDPSLCGRIISTNPYQPTDGMRTVCYRHVAEQLKDLEICKLIETDGPNSSYVDSDCVFLVAIATNNPEVCHHGGWPLASGGLCYLYFTERGADRTLCDSAWEDRARDLCYYGVAKYSNNVAVCDNDIKEQFRKDQCYNIIAKQTNDVSVCDKIIGYDSDYEKRDCKESFK